MRIRTDGKFAYREDLVDDVADRLGENTRVGAVEASCEFTRQMLPALTEAVEHEDMTEELAKILSTRGRRRVRTLDRRDRPRVVVPRTRALCRNTFRGSAAAELTADRGRLAAIIKHL